MVAYLSTGNMTNLPRDLFHRNEDEARELSTVVVDRIVIHCNTQDLCAAVMILEAIIVRPHCLLTDCANI